MTAQYSPSPISVSKLFSKLAIIPSGLTGGAGTTVIGTACYLRDFDYFAILAVLISTALTKKAGIVQLEIICSDDSGMSVNVTQVKTTGTIASAGAGDLQCLECLAEEVTQISDANGYNSQYVAARVTLYSATDVVQLISISSGAEAQALGLTSPITTAPSTT